MLVPFVDLNGSNGSAEDEVSLEKNLLGTAEADRVGWRDEPNGSDEENGSVLYKQSEIHLMLESHNIQKTRNKK